LPWLHQSILSRPIDCIPQTLPPSLFFVTSLRPHPHTLPFTISTSSPHSQRNQIAVASFTSFPTIILYHQSPSRSSSLSPPELCPSTSPLSRRFDLPSLLSAIIRLPVITSQARHARWPRLPASSRDNQESCWSKPRRLLPGHRLPSGQTIPSANLPASTQLSS
jgi:hypothetical protein